MMDTYDDIFAVARELPEHEREAYLREACHSPEQRSRVVALLADATAADAFFDDVLRPPVAPPVAERPGAMIGRYKLLQKLGEGGFGVVFMAEQREPIVRRVALKIIKAGMDTRQVIARFEAERQALAMMDHPGIAKVFDAGATSTGRPYFVMELVRGLPITTFCDQREYDTPQRLELFAEICEAVQHAHQKGIIHRDLKPSNIIVGLDGDRPLAKVIDFGIAKATQQQLTEMTLFTRFEQFVGTPLYISPEQASLSAMDIDTRSDIYSLGVLLYELLTGRPPIDASELLAGGFDEMRRIIREKEAPKPSTRFATIDDEEVRTIAKARHSEPKKLGLLIRGELDWIVLKALEKDRSRRYATANALRDDLRRFLHNEPVSAAAPSRIYQARKFLVRHRAGATAAAVMAAVLMAATAVSTMQALRARAAERETLASLGRVAAERDEKERARRGSEALAGFLTDVFRSPDPARDGRSVTVAETLDRAAAKLAADFEDQPDRRAHFQQVLGGTYHALGLYREAAAMQEEAYWHFFHALGAEHPQTLATMGELALSHRFGGSPGYALNLQEKLLDIRRRLNGPDDPLTLGAMQNLSITYDDLGRGREARELRQSVLDRCRQIFGPDHFRTLSAMQNLAISHDASGRRDLALALREEVYEKLRSVRGPEHPETLRAMSNLAISQDHAGDHDRALALREEVHALSVKVRGAEHPETLQLMDNLAISYDRSGRGEAAARLRAEAGEIRRAGLEKTSARESLNSMIVRAGAYAASGRHAVAKALREETGRRAESELPATHAEISIAELEVLEARLEHRVGHGRWKDAASDAERLLELDPRSLRHVHLAAVVLRSGDAAAYRELLGRAVSALGETGRAEDLERLAKLGTLMADPAWAATAGERADRALALAGGGGYLYPWILVSKGFAELRRGKPAAAASFFELSLAAEMAAEGHVTASAGLAMARHHLRETTAAREALAAARAILGETFNQADGTAQQVPETQWHDWLIARCLFREAAALIGH